MLILSIVYFGIDLILEETLDLEMPRDLEEMFGSMSFRPDGILDICILGPIAEELCMRGFVLRHLLRMFKNPWAAIILSGLLFGLIHANIAQFVSASLFGILMGWIAYRTNSLIPTIIMHVTNNTIVTLLTWILPESEDLDLSTIWIFAIILVSLALFVFVINHLKPLMINFAPMQPAECIASEKRQDSDESQEVGDAGPSYWTVMACMLALIFGIFILLVILGAFLMGK